MPESVVNRRWRGRFLAAVVIGLACMALLIVVSVIAQSMDTQTQHSVLYAVAGGAVVGLIRMGSPVARYVAFLVGLLLGLIYFVMLAAVVPGDWIGQMIAGLVVVGLASLVSALTGMWVQLWAVFLGALLFIGAYQPLFDAQLWMFETQSIGTLCSMVFLSTIGFCVVIAVEIIGTGKAVRKALDEQGADADGGAPIQSGQLVVLDVQAGDHK